MRIPRDIDGPDLAKRLSTLGYVVTRQAGSHMRLTTQQNGEHHITVPAHKPLRVGTLNAILSGVATHFAKSKSEIAELIFN